MAQAKRNPGDAARRFQTAVALFQRGEIGAADRLCRGLMKGPARHPDLLHLHGLIADRQGNFAQARSRLRKAVKAKPSAAPYHNSLGLTLRHLGELEAAAASFERAVKLRPDFARAWYNLGMVRTDQEAFGAALNAYEQACHHDPGMAAAHNSRGLTLQVLGRLDEAHAAYREALSLKSDYAEAHFHLAHARRAESAGDPQLAAVEKLLAAPGLSRTDESWLQSACGKLNDDVGNHDRAFQCHKRANDLIQGNRLLENKHKPLAEPFIQAFDRAQIGRAGTAALDRADRIFIVGMPRSGSTLLERMLAAHPAVEAGGERQELPGNWHGIPNASEADERLAWATAENAELERAARALDRRLARPGTARYLTDKLPGNLWHLGLVGMLLPRVPVLFTWRDPRDTGLSCYFTRFQGSYHPYSNDLYLIGRMIRATHLMISHWLQVLPNPMMVVEYEKLVAGPEAVMKEVFACCGLPDSAEKRAPEPEESAVTTASNWQVRQKLYHRAVGRWRPYEPHLKPLLDGLGDILDTPAPGNGGTAEPQARLR